MSRTMGGKTGTSKITTPVGTIPPQPGYSKPSQKSVNVRTPSPKSGQKSEGAPRFKGGSPIKSPSPSRKAF